jgi:putative membrane protein
LALKFSAYLPENDHDNRTFLTAMIGNYGIAMKEHLREGVIWEELETIPEKYINQIKSAKHVPNKIAALIYERTNELYKSGKISGDQFIVLDKQIESLTDVVGACERIRNTPIPFSYSVHLKKFLFFYIAILPFGLIHDLKYWSIPIMVMVFYAFTGLEVIGEEIEDPFGRDVNDLPTDAISQNIKRNVHEILLNESI